MDIDVSELQLILLPGKCPPKQFQDHYLKAYYCWREVWEATLPLTTDEFTRQDEVLALFHKGECSALACFKWVEASEYPLKNNGNRLLVFSQLTILPKYGHNSNDIPWKELLMGLVVERFHHSQRDAIIGEKLDDAVGSSVSEIVKIIFPKTIALAKPIFASICASDDHAA
jgi:hypothetical protein